MKYRDCQFLVICFTGILLFCLVNAKDDTDFSGDSDQEKDDDDQRIELTCYDNGVDYCATKKEKFAFNDGCHICRCRKVKQKPKCFKGPCQFYVKNLDEALKYCDKVDEKNEKRWKKFQSKKNKENTKTLQEVQVKDKAKKKIPKVAAVEKPPISDKTENITNIKVNIKDVENAIPNEKAMAMAMAPPKVPTSAKIAPKITKVKKFKAEEKTATPTTLRVTTMNEIKETVPSTEPTKNFYEDYVTEKEMPSTEIVTTTTTTTTTKPLATEPTEKTIAPTTTQQSLATTMKKKDSIIEITNEKPSEVQGGAAPIKSVQHKAKSVERGLHKKKRRHHKRRVAHRRRSHRRHRGKRHRRGHLAGQGTVFNKKLNSMLFLVSLFTAAILLT